MSKKIFCILCVLSLSVFAVSAQDNVTSDTEDVLTSQEMFDEAQQAFSQAGKIEKTSPEQAREEYLKAYRRYQALVKKDTMNAAVYYNLGNTCYRLGRVGEAILNYRRALELKPHDDNILHNLEIVRAQRQDNIQQKEETRIVKALLFWHYDLSKKTRLILFATFFVVFWAGLILRALCRTKKFVPMWMLGLFAVMWIALLSSLTLCSVASASDVSGVITVNEVVAREGNGENYKPCFKTPLHEGTEFTVFEKRPDWYGIDLEDGRKCWIPKKSCELVR